MFSSQRPRIFCLLFSLTCLVTPLCLARAQIAAQPSAIGNLATTEGLRLQISTESENGVFFERDTLRTKTPIEWTIRAWNTLPDARRLRLSWRIIDASGKEIAKDGEKTTFAPATEVRRRQFFEPRMLGAYRIEVEARGERKGADDVARVQTSLAVIASPLVSNAAVTTSPLSSATFGVETAAAPSAGESEWFRALGVPIVVAESSVSIGKTWPQGLSQSGKTENGNRENGSGESANAWRFLEAKVDAPPLVLRDEVRVENDSEIVRAVSSSVKRNILVKLAGGTTSTRWPQMSENALARMASGAAWAQMTRLLGSAVPEGRLFEPSPLLWGASFKMGSNRIVALWNDAAASNGKSRLVTQLEGVRVLDLWGNEIARSDGKKLVIPLTSEPVYVLTSAPQSAVAKAWSEARWEGNSPVAVQILPFSRPIIGGSQLPRVLVRVQNVSWLPFAGRVQIDLPKRWKAANDKLSVQLQAGESKLLVFTLLQAEREANEVYNLEVEVLRGRNDWKTRQDVPVSTITVADEKVRVDGAVDEWNLANWMNIGAPQDETQARLALRSDNDNLYIACQVREPALQIRDAAQNEYSFWKGDAIQLALGVRDVNAARGAVPEKLGALDSDYGFLLSPFAVAENGAPVGRVLRLWSPQIAFGEVRDVVRWGGVAAGSQCVLRRDDKLKLTTWEAAIPLSQLPELQPMRRLQNSENVRVGWALHNDSGPKLEWATQANAFPWTRNTGSFLPQSEMSLSVQTFAGFSRAVAPLAATENAEMHFDASVWNTSPAPAPAPTATPKPTPNVTATPNLTPTPQSTPNATPASTPRPTPSAPPAPSPAPKPPRPSNTPTPQTLPPLPPAPASSLPPMRPEPLPQLPSPPAS